jgi:hypothetical protein
MPWTAPVNPVAGTVITVAYATANILDPIRWLRLMTGNADPPGSSYVPVSGSVSSVAWGKVTADVLANGAVTDIAMLNQKVNRSGDSISGTLVVGGNVTNQALTVLNGDTTITRAFVGAAAQGILYLGSTAGAVYVSGTGTSLQLGGATVQAVNLLVATAGIRSDNDIIASRPAAPTTGYVFFGNTGLRFIGFDGTNMVASGNTIITSANIGSQSVASAANASQVGGRMPTATPAANAIPISDGTGKLAAGWLPAMSGDASSVTGHVPTATPAPGALPLANASGKLDDWVTPSVVGATVPTGLIAMFEDTNPANMPSGWSRYTAGDGRIIVGAGTTFGQTFTATNNYGASWAHQHPVSGVPVSVGVTVSSVSVTGTATGGPSDNTGSSSAVNGLAAAGGVNLNTTGHTHPLSGVSLAVSASGSGSGTGTGSATGNTSDTTWLPPMRSLMYIRKN